MRGRCGLRPRFSQLRFIRVAAILRCRPRLKAWSSPQISPRHHPGPVGYNDSKSDAEPNCRSPIESVPGMPDKGGLIPSNRAASGPCVAPASHEARSSCQRGSS